MAKLNLNLGAIHVMTIVFLIACTAGAIVTVVDPATLPFNKYLQDIAVGAGLLGIGRGISSNKP